MPKKKEKLELTGEDEARPVKRFTNKPSEVERLHSEKYRIKKVFFSKKGATTIHFMERNNNGNWDDNKRTCAERPRPEFDRHLQSLASEIDFICGFPKGYSEEMRVYSVTYGTIGRDNVMTAAISAEKSLGDDKTLKITTPAIAAPYEESTDDIMLINTAIMKLDYMWNEAVRYILGERSQLELDEDEMEISAE